MANIIVLDQLALQYELEDGFSFNTLSTSKYIEKLKVIDRLPLNKGVLFFSDAVWDFSKYTTLNIPKSNMIFKFEDIPDEFGDVLKSYVLIKTLENSNKIQSIHRKFSEIRKFFKHLINNNIFSVYEITPLVLNTYITVNKHLSGKSMRLLKGSILDFYYFYSINYADLLTTEIKKELEQSDYSAFQAECEENKYNDIPNKYFDKLVQFLLHIIDDETALFVHRATACIILILSQTGLRISEILDFEIDTLKETQLFNGEIRYYFEYKTWKRENGNNVSSIEKTYTNELSKKGFDTLLHLCKKYREKKKVRYLYVTPKTQILPISSYSFSKSYLSFFTYYGIELDAIDSGDRYPELSTTQIHDKMYARLHPNAKTLTYPTTPQFRVHVCTELYNKNVPLKYIAKFMGHLASQMEGYYVRPKENQIQEDIDFSKKVIEDIVTGNLTLLGPNANEFTHTLKQFLSDNNYNTATDVQVIVESLSKKIPIRSKTGGVCIKSSPLRECSKDAYTNELYCAYGVCPNIYHFYYMAGVSYRQGRELITTINLNAERGHKKQVQKEINMLKTIINQKLIPELNELKKEIDKKGVDNILYQYPDLSNIIENFDAIYEEVLHWKTLKVE